MPDRGSDARAYLEKLEADRRAAIDMSERKAAEAKLIAARQEGFRAAIDIFGEANFVNSSKFQTEKPTSRRRQRDLYEIILRELSFSGHPMTLKQIARAIDYTPERTETALNRLEHNGQVIRNQNRWAAVVASNFRRNGPVAGTQPHYTSDLLRSEPDKVQ
jgi:hypothetical protein